MIANIPDLLTFLKPVQTGDALMDVMTADRINAIQDLLMALCSGDNIQTGIGTGITKDSGPNWVKLTAQLGRHGSPEPEPHPFEVLTDRTSTLASPQVKIALDSWALKSRQANDKLTITGLDTAFAIASGDYIWIEVAVAAGDVTGSASIQHGSSAWGSYPLPYDDTGDSQGACYFLIAYAQEYPGDGSETAGPLDSFPYRLVIPYAGGRMQVIQCLTQNLIISMECEGTEPVVGFAPWSAIPGP